jgi:ABC-2 type transport system permease protein
LLAAGGLTLAYVLFWTLVCVKLAAWQQSGEVILASLVTIWLCLGIIFPAAGRIAIDRAVPLPSGADIILTQREAVNDAWDLPKDVTMAAFVERHPQWAAHSAVERPFAWKWYFAFQQVGDQKAKALSDAYTAGRLRRDRLAAWLGDRAGLGQSQPAQAQPAQTQPAQAQPPQAQPHQNPQQSICTYTCMCLYDHDKHMCIYIHI